ncbi:MAG: ABC transporter permease [Spirochaetia bacterium]|jgi:ABC-2 type transport system permease protein|nr:ABC transporter permease [Spirochaetia bacterium]
MSEREGSALTGLRVVFAKELQDFTRSIRMIVLTLLILLTAGTSIYVAAKTMKSYVDEDSFLLLSLFTSSSNPIPSFLSLMSFLVPLTGIALGFDAISKEFQDRTLGRVLSQPIYRDVLLFGKGLGSLVAMALVLLALWLLVIGCAMLFLGVPPTGEQIGRALIFLLITLLYGVLWFVIAMWFSILFRQSATSALVSIALWLFFMIFWPIIAQLIAYGVAGGSQVVAARTYSVLSRFSPYVLYSEASIAILNPTTRSLGVVLFYQMQGALGGSPLPFGQSLLLIWPQLTSFVAAIILVFTLGYAKFQRMEIRM